MVGATMRYQELLDVLALLGVLRVAHDDPQNGTRPGRTCATLSGTAAPPTCSYGHQRAKLHDLGLHRLMRFEEHLVSE